MFYSIEGKVLQIEKDFVVVLNNGIGYKIFLGNFSLQLKKNQEVFLYLFQSVKENSLDLFGFQTEVELKLFELLISISGIGPKVALSIMDVTTPASLKKAVISQNLEELTKVSGIGKKNAQKILIELANKIEKIEVKDENVDFDLEVYETLEALGFSRIQILEALKNIEAESTDEKIKEALKILGK